MPNPSSIDPKIIANIIERELQTVLGNKRLHSRAGEFEHGGMRHTVYHVSTYAAKGTAVILDDGTLVILKLGSLLVEDMQASVAQSGDTTC